jgi:hypothetical protein
LLAARVPAQELPDWSGSCEIQFGGMDTGYVDLLVLSEDGRAQVNEYRRMRDADSGAFESI